jgi:hypothetical protein
MFFLSLLGLGESFVLSAAWHVEQQLLRLLFNPLAGLGGSQRGSFAGIRMTTHSFVIPAMK